MKKLTTHVLTLIIFTCLAINANAYIFRALAKAEDGWSGTPTLVFGVDNNYRSTSWIAPPGEYVALAIPSSNDWAYTNNPGTWLVMDIKKPPYYLFNGLHFGLWTTPGWTHGNVVFKLWLSDTSGFPIGSKILWAALDGRTGQCLGTINSTPVVGSEDNPLASLTIHAPATANPNYQAMDLWLTSPEPDSIFIILIGITSLVYSRITRPK